MNMLQVILAIIGLALSYPIALVLKYYTKDEKQLYKKYFPALLWILLILLAVSYTLDLVTALTLTFMFLVIFFWNKN